MKLAVARFVVVVALTSCSIPEQPKFGAPCATDHDCGRLACVNTACVPSHDVGEGEGDAGEGEGNAGEGEGVGGEGEGGDTRDDGCATPCPCSAVCVNAACIPADVLGACSSDDTCACGQACDPASASCSIGAPPAIRAVLTWQADPNASDTGPDLDLVATKADAGGHFCIAGDPGGSCATFTPGPRSEDCPDDSLECFFATCSLDGTNASGFTWDHPVWNEVNEPGNPVLVGSFDASAPEVIAVQDLPDDGDYLFGVSFCTESQSGTTSAPYQLALELNGVGISHFNGVVREGGYVDVAIVHVSSTSGLSVTPL